jgi:hypothetical protein
VVLDKQENVLVVPRESLGVGDSGTVVQVQSGDEWNPAPVTVGTLSDTEAVITKGLQDGAVIRRRPGGAS